MRLAEPRSEGKTLSQWLVNQDPDFLWIPNDLYGHIHDELWYKLIEDPPTTTASQQFQPESPEPQKYRAIRALGTNALPTFLNWLVAKPSVWDRRRAWVAGRLPRAWGERIYPGTSGLPPSARLRIAALEGFEILGTNAVPALPVLSNILFNVDSDLPVAWSIAQTGPPGIALLAEAVSSGTPAIRDRAALVLGLEAASSAIPALVSAVERGVLSYHVLGALGRMGCEDPRLTAALMRQVNSTNELTGFRMEVLLLGLQGERARSAIPALIRRYRECSDPAALSDRKLFRRIIRRLDPDAERQLPPSPTDETDDTWP